MAQSVLPGSVIGPVLSNTPGHGVHLQSGQLISSLAGTLKQSTKASTYSVSRASSALLPEVGTVILGRITRTNSRQATIAILAIGMNGEHVCRDSFSGLIRQQDIRATEVDKVKMSESFKVGDIVRAVIISLGDERAYYMSTAKNEFGVVLANSEQGNQMYPISWREMQDPASGVKELRKVAKPV
ncbi:hypothetical protein AMS68_000263 [Peltaster fructicola]|uniref:S1 motif domain-containing protein n=1 Tax=Peltaster fructicola TaxID=286661 RepID=A0A6H0XJ53_9PEZI|nr:hypothetical protein AMS68_000263 [Peltaster fructicola]